MRTQFHDVDRGWNIQLGRISLVSEGSALKQLHSKNETECIPVADYSVGRIQVPDH